MKKLNKVEQLVLDTILETISSGIKVYRRDVGSLVLAKFNSTEEALEFAKQDKKFEEDAQLIDRAGKYDKNLDDKDKWIVSEFFEWVLNRFVGHQKSCKTKPLLVKPHGMGVGSDTFYKNPNYVA